MHRRQLLGILGGALAMPALGGLSTDELLPLGRRVHLRIASRTAVDLFDRHQMETVATIAEQIIPQTDTPGARAARVHEFIELIVAEWFGDEERRHFLDGLADVDARSRQAFGRDFVDGSEREQVELLTAFDREVAALRGSGGRPHEHFFSQIKWLTLHGYYTSEIGVTLEQQYRTIPGRWEACVELPTRAAGGL